MFLHAIVCVSARVSVVDCVCLCVRVNMTDAQFVRRTLYVVNISYGSYDELSICISKIMIYYIFKHLLFTKIIFSLLIKAASTFSGIPLKYLSIDLDSLIYFPVFIQKR